MTMTITDPYAEAFDAYRNAGWSGVLPLPYRRKKTPPDGYTGYRAAEPSYADCATWAMDGPQNICLHLPPGVVGIDVDAYGDKPGASTLEALVHECGALPATWLSTSRGDGISGIRLFRVPADARLVTQLPGVEIIQHFHRYIVCWPSVHPETTAVYEWVNEIDGTTSSVTDPAIPPFDALPELPVAWLERLTSSSTAPAKADVGGDAITTFLDGLPAGEPCRHVTAAAGHVMREGSRHDLYNGAVLGIIDRGRAGCPGAVEALRRLGRMFAAEVTQPGDGQRTKGEAEAEWSRSVVGAIAITLEKRPEQGLSCPDDYMADLMMAETAAAEVGDSDDQGEHEPTPEDEREFKYRLEVARKAAELQLLDDARDVLAARKAGKAPDLQAHTLSAFLAQPDEIVPYRISGLWPVNGRVLLAAAAKAGKTTLVTNLLKALADGETFLGCFEVEPLSEGRTIVYLNMEVGENQIRRWMRRAGIVNAGSIHVVNLRGAASALTLATEQGRERVAGWLRSLNAGMVILDPLAPLLAALGVDENDNSQVARFFGLWGETLALADVGDDLIVHHTGHAGQRSRGAARFLDEPDALWTISKDAAVDEDGDEVYDAQEPRFFKATGRDVEQPEQPLIFDGATGVLSLGMGSRKAIRAAAKHDRIRATIVARLRQGQATQNDLTRKLGLNYNDAKQTLDALVDDGDVAVSSVGQAKVYNLTCSNDNSNNRHLTPTDTEPLVSVTDTTLYRGVSTSDAADTVIRACDDCGTDTGHAGAKLCKPCADARTYRP